MHSSNPNHPDGAIARIVSTDPVLQDLQKTIAEITHGKTSHSAFIARDADELALEGKNLPELKKLFGNYILEGAAVLFPSERGVGKTFFLMQICLAVSKGYDQFLNESIELHGNTLYLDFELGERAFKRRLAKLYTPTGPPSQHKMLVVNAKGSLTRSIDKFTQLIEQYKPVLVVVDNLRTAFRETDNEKNSAMTAIIAGLMDLKNEKGFSLVVAHHIKKNVSASLTHSDLQSGAGAITDLFDADFFLRRSSQDKNYRLLVRKKSRFCEEAEGAKLIELNTHSLWFEFVEDEVEEAEHIQIAGSTSSPKANKDGKDEQILALLSAGASQRQIVQELRVSFRRIQEAQQRATTTDATGSTTFTGNGSQTFPF
jgi:predicted ATP-dependent serine protease